MPTTTIPTLNFLLPSLHPSTLLDVSFPLGHSQDTATAGPSRDPVVRNLPIRYGEFEAVGIVKRMIATGDDELVVVADDAFRLSTLSLANLKDDEVPEVVRQASVKSTTKGATWSGLLKVDSGLIASLSSGHLSYHPASSEASSQSTRTLPNTVTCIASSSNPSSGSFALAGKGQDVSVWDIERTFGGIAEEPASGAKEGGGKRKKEGLQSGEIWRAKNLPPNHLRLQQPIHHMSLAYLPNSEHLLVSGTRAGTIRRYDTRQRKPLSDWKVAKEGGVACVIPGDENELFFTDQSGYVTALDLRTGKQVYALPLPSTPHHLLAIPAHPSASTSGAIDSYSTSTRVGLASFATDATFRLHATAGVERKGNRGDKEKWKRGVVGAYGGVGGQGIWRGWGEMDVVVETKATKKPRRKAGEGGEEDDSEEEEDEEDEEANEEEMWEGMSVVDEDGLGSEDEEDEEVAGKKGKKQRKE